MRPNRLKAKLLRGDPAYGTTCTLGSPESVEIASHVGFDFVFVDAQHGFFNRDSLRESVRAIQTTDTSPVVRPSVSSDPGQLEFLLDSGYSTLMIPMVNTAEHARRVVDAAYYPPLGHRSTGSCRAPLYYGDDYYACFNDELLVFAYIEHLDGVRNVEQIMAVEGISGCLVGPGDLAVSMGLPTSELGNISDKMHDVIGTVCKTTQAAGKIPGLYANTPEQARQCFEIGFRCIVIGYEHNLIDTAWRQIVAQLKG